MSETYWMTISFQARDMTAAENTARITARWMNGQVVQVDHEPPQGAMIVGCTHEDCPEEERS